MRRVVLSRIAFAAVAVAGGTILQSRADLATSAPAGESSGRRAIGPVSSTKAL